MEHLYKLDLQWLFVFVACNQHLILHTFCYVHDDSGRRMVERCSSTAQWESGRPTLAPTNLDCNHHLILHTFCYVLDDSGRRMVRCCSSTAQWESVLVVGGQQEHNKNTINLKSVKSAMIYLGLHKG